VGAAHAFAPLRFSIWHTDLGRRARALTMKPSIRVRDGMACTGTQTASLR
jgi:hypothetical protein